MSLEMLAEKARMIEAILNDEFNHPGTGALYCMDSGEVTSVSVHGDPTSIIEGAALVVAKTLYLANVTDIEPVFELLQDRIAQGLIRIAAIAAEANRNGEGESEESGE